MYAHIAADWPFLDAMPTERMAQLRAILGADAFACLVGLRLDAAESDAATLSVALRDELRQPAGLLHGGVHSILADTAVAQALGTTLRPGFSIVTVRLDTSYFAPVRSGRTTARARIVRKGRRLAHGSVELTSESGELVATASCIYAVNIARATSSAAGSG